MLLAAVCVLVIGVYVYMAQSPIYEPWKSLTPEAAHSQYSLLVQGFRAGQLSLKIDVPPGLTELPDPYDPTANDLYRETPYKFHDLIYYKGKLYLYFGVAPAVLLFWPFAALTGRYLLHRDAVLIFCTIGFLVSTGLLRALWRRYFAEVSAWVVAACAVALGLATGVPALLSWAGLQQVPISCGYMLTMLALAAIWGALHGPEPRKRSGWLAAASLAYGLAVASRPNLVFGGIILLVPVVQAWRERRKVWVPLLAAIGPILLVGLGLMFYNAQRFDDPFEIGVHYALTAENLVSRRLFGLQYLWFHFRVYFLEPGRWSGRFPFLHNITMPPLPAGHYGMEVPFGILTNIPVAWMALAAPLAWRTLPGQAGSGLRWFAGTVALLFGICAVILCLIFATAFRYEVDFLPTLMVLAVVGILGCERVLVDRPAWRRGARLGWGLLLGFSVAFNLLVTLEYYSYTQNDLGMELLEAGKPTEAVAHFERALRLKPDYAGAHFNLGKALRESGKIEEAIAHYEQALWIKPDYAEAHYNLGTVLMQSGRMPEAIEHWEQVLRIKPDYAEAHYNLGTALMQSGRMPEAIEHWEQVLRIKPDFAEAHNNLGSALMQSGRMPEAIEHLQQALRIKPDLAEAHYNLGSALMQSGRMPEAIEHLQQALRIKPDYAEAHYQLGVGLEQVGRVQEALGHYEEAVRIKPDYTQAQNALARLQARQ
jgi:tetratricopeptide (TPR) repeat protein